MKKVLINGKVVYVKYKDTLAKYQYSIFVGEEYIGDIIKIKNYWIASYCAKDSLEKPVSLLNVSGFQNRDFSVDFMLKLRGYI